MSALAAWVFIKGRAPGAFTLTAGGWLVEGACVSFLDVGDSGNSTIVLPEVGVDSKGVEPTAETREPLGLLSKLDSLSSGPDVDDDWIGGGSGTTKPNTLDTEGVSLYGRALGVLCVEDLVVVICERIIALAARSLGVPTSTLGVSHRLAGIELAGKVDPRDGNGSRWSSDPYEPGPEKATFWLVAD